jgi:hypothetical protein
MDDGRVVALEQGPMVDETSPRRAGQEAIAAGARNTYV